MNGLLIFLQGKKTYLMAVLIVGLLVGQASGWWKLPPELYAGMCALALAFLRAGVARIDQPEDIGSPSPRPSPPGEGEESPRVGRPGGIGTISPSYFFFCCVMVTAFIGGLVAGCTSFSTTAFRSEQLIVDGATGSMHAWNLYYQQQTNAVGTNVQACIALQQRNNIVLGYATNFYRTLVLVDGLRQVYETNSAATNRAALQAGMEALALQGTNVSSVAKSLITMPLTQ